MLLRAHRSRNLRRQLGEDFAERLTVAAHQGIRRSGCDLDSPADEAFHEYYLRTGMVFETASAKYDWLNRIVGVGVGRREPSAAVYDVFEIL